MTVYKHCITCRIIRSIFVRDKLTTKDIGHERNSKIELFKIGHKENVDDLKSCTPEPEPPVSYVEKYSNLGGLVDRTSKRILFRRPLNQFNSTFYFLMTCLKL